MIAGPTIQLARRLARKFGVLIPMKRALAKVNFSYRSSPYGRPATIPSLQGMRCDSTEPFMVAVLADALRDTAGTFVDVGVNLGQTLLKVRGIDPKRAYVGFEPNPSCVHYLSELIKANGFEQCRVLPVGLFTDDAVLELLMISDIPADAAGSVIGDLRPASSVKKTIHVPVVRYETVARFLAEKVSIVKVDVEGAELEVLKTLRPLIERDRPVMLIEVLPAATLDRQRELEQLVANWRYTIDLILKDAQQNFVGLERMTTFDIRGDLRRCDYVLAPVVRN